MTSVFVIDVHADEYKAELLKHQPNLDVGTAINLSDVPADLSKYEVLIAFGTSISNDFLDRLTNLKWIQSLATGVDHFLRWPGLKPHMAITSGRGIHGAPMRETVAYLMLNASRDVVGEVERKQQHVWERRLWSLLTGKTAVVVGSGIAGSAIGKLLQAFEMHVIGLTRSPRAVPGFDEVMATDELVAAASRADYLINILPASKNNLDLFNKPVFDAMKPTAYFINAGRGETVDEAAMIDALKNKRIAGAGLDVYKGEPLSKDHVLWDMPNVFMTPHIGGYFIEYESYVMPIVIENMQLFVAGKPTEMQNIVAR